MPLKKINRNVDQDSHTWEVKNINEIFSKVDPKNFLDESIQEVHNFFTNFQGHKIDWYVKLIFCNNKLHGGFMIEFDAVEKFEPKNHVTCNFYLVDADKNTYFIGRKNRKFHSTRFYFPQTCSSTLCDHIQLPTTEDKLLPNNTMTLLIELNTYLDDNPIFPFEFIERSIALDANLSDDFFKLYKFRNEGDVIIYVQGVEFRVHKTVFETRCHQQMSDINNIQSALADVKPEIFERVLEFLYTGKVKDLDDHAEDLLKAASQLKLDRLKNLCEFSLADNYLTYENSNEVKKLAASCDAFQLLRNLILLKNTRNITVMDFYCTPSGTLIAIQPTGKKELAKNYFKNGIPEGIRIVPEEMALLL